MYQGEDRTFHLQRFLETIRATNRAHVGATEESSFLLQVCRIAVEVSGYRFAWVGLAGPAPECLVRTAAQAGFEEGYLESIQVTWADVPRGRGPVGSALRTGKTSVVQDAQTDPCFAPWREDALRNGFRGVVALPLLDGYVPFGVLVIYTGGAGGFPPDEVRLLEEVASGLSHGILELRRRVASERALRESEARYRTLVDTTPDPILVLDPEDRYLAANRSTYEVLCNPKAGLLGRTLEEVGFPADALATYRAARDRVLAGETVQFDLDVVMPDGRGHLYEVVLSPVAVDGEIAAVWMRARDVSELRRAQEEKARLHEQLLQSQKMDALGRLAAGVAHDFNNVLTAILSFAEFARDDAGDAEAVREDVEQIVAAAQRARRLTGQLLAFGRQSTDAPERLAVGEVVRGVEKMVNGMLGASVRLNMQVADGLPEVRIDRGKLEQVVVNLLVNARDAMPEGGEIGVEVRAPTADEAQVCVDGAKAAGLRVRAGGELRVCVEGSAPAVVLSVRDTGAGIAPEVLAHVFEPFFTTKPEGRGTGLGLSTVYGIIEQACGCLRVESAPEAGTTFRVLLPAATDQAGAG